MLLSDGEIKQAMAANKLRIDNFSDKSLEAASYDMRVGKRFLVSNEEVEIDLEKKGSAVLEPGTFALLTTYESVWLDKTIAGHIGVKSYYTRKGIVMLAGLQIDPGFEAVLVLGMYNASPRSLTLDYLAPFWTVEFHQLAKAVERPFVPGAEQKEGQIPRVDKDYLRTLETQSLSQMSQSLTELTRNVGSLSSSVRTMEWVLGLGLGFLAILITALGVIVTVKH
jgi:deoxycytidine triphosphate deaminase